MALRDKIRQAAYDLGFDLVGIAPAYPAPGLSFYHTWLAEGYHGMMGYLARPDRLLRREDPAVILPGIRSVVCVGVNYYAGAAQAVPPERGAIASYAWGEDYHDWILPRLNALAESIVAEEAKLGKPAAYRCYVDTGPILEKAYAARAGLGFMGKNTCLIHPQIGSWFFLGEILLDVPLDASEPAGGISCGTCRRCLDACPTGALVAPYVMDARRCISYLTIELKGPIPYELRPLLGNRIYGCDVCQQVCPWQRSAKVTTNSALWSQKASRAAPLLLDLMQLDEAAFERRYKGSPIYRIKRWRLLRNVAVALGNWGDAAALPVLVRALKDPEPLIRGHSAWALGCVGGREARAALRAALQSEQDPYVVEEVQRALEVFPVF